MTDIPEQYVRVNHFGVIFTFLLAVVLQQPMLIGLLWLIQVVHLVSGGRANLFVLVAKPFWKKPISSAEAQSPELFRFNASIAVALQTLSVLVFLVWPGTGWGYVISGVHAVAAIAALDGYCMGCFLYYQWKQRQRK
ncbi:DUF4395 domain-containing protein [Brevibacillus sp. H7]|uniref:DUF4395 domain-containing protein n=1 Tax=Brevibacillus sp. H7 TaxID=3349138 RepID=UPI00380E3064